MHYGALPLLKDMVEGLPYFKVERTRVCKGYALSKHANIAFPSSGYRLRGILNMVHSNVCGPMSLALLTSNIYCVSFVDDHACKSCLYFMKTRDEAFSRFQKFKDLKENQIDKKMKVLRSNNKGECTSKEFDSFCRDIGIKRELIVPYSP